MLHDHCFKLWFAALHAVHHWSMVCPCDRWRTSSYFFVFFGRLWEDLTRLQGIVLPDDFGFAPSTLVYKGSDAPLGRAKI
ncbi:hypothetical protein ID866_834 [Astraeus odoratus]|nr:hypothetical protein ID866_834 [Astraeus odoratus]